MNVITQFFYILREKKWLWGVIAGIIISTAVITYFIGSKQNDGNNLNSFIPNFQPQQDSQIEEKDENILTVLLLGYGGAGHQGGYLSDVIHIVHLDFAKQKTALISIPRDLWVSLPNGTERKINAAYNIDRQSGNKEATTARSMAII